MASILVLGRTGEGKSTSLFENNDLGIQGINSEETFIIQCTLNSAKALPTKSSRALYKDFDGKSGNLARTSSGMKVVQAMSWAVKQPHIKNIIIDDMQYVMAHKYVTDQSGGYDVFKNIGSEMLRIISGVTDPNKNFICLSHYEEVFDASGKLIGRKAKTVGKMTDQYLTIEGNFETVLYTRVIPLKKMSDHGTMVDKVFVTNADGEFNEAKSPFGMFDSLHIKNDMGLVLTQVEKWNN